MSATNLYHNLPKLARVKLPSGTEYAVIDYNGRELIAPIFNEETNYSTGDYVVYDDNLYMFTSNHTGAWTGSDATNTDLAAEIKNLKSAIGGGVHYRGTTTTPIYDGCTTNPITINGESVTADTGDLVIFALNRQTTTQYAANIEIPAYSYWYRGSLASATFYIFAYDVACTPSANTGWDAVENRMEIVGSFDQSHSNTRLEFIWDGTRWNGFGGANAFGDLAFKDQVAGTYTAPTGTGSVTVKEYERTELGLVTTSITGVSGTESVSKMTSGTAVEVAKASATPTTVATAGSEVVYGTADVGTAVTYGTANPGTAVTGIAKVDTTAKTFTVEGIKVAVDSDCLQFSTASTGNIYGVESIGVSITPAVASTSTLTPAVAADTTRKVRGVGGTTTVTSAVSNGTIVPWSETAKTVAVAATSATTVATGSANVSGGGAKVVTSISSTNVTKTVTVNTESQTVTSK